MRPNCEFQQLDQSSGKTQLGDFMTCPQNDVVTCKWSNKNLHHEVSTRISWPMAAIRLALSEPYPLRKLLLHASVLIIFLHPKCPEIDLEIEPINLTGIRLNPQANSFKFEVISLRMIGCYGLVWVTTGCYNQPRLDMNWAQHPAAATSPSSTPTPPPVLRRLGKVHGCPHVAHICT